MAAGISAASVLLLLGATGLMSFFYRFIPFPVVHGVQPSQASSSPSQPSRTSDITRISPPAALLVFLLGLALCFARDPSIVGDLKFGPSKIQIVKIKWEDWKIGFFWAAIPQIPFSLLNSVIAVCKLSSNLFPDIDMSRRRGNPPPREQIFGTGDTSAHPSPMNGFTQNAESMGA